MLDTRSRRGTRYAPCGRCAQTAAPSQFTKRAARADRMPALLADADSATAGHRPPLNQQRWRGSAKLHGMRCLGPPRWARRVSSNLSDRHRRWSKGVAGLAVARLCGAEKHRVQGRRAGAPCELTCGICLSAVSEANAASYAAGPWTRASQGSRSEAQTAAAKRHSEPGRAFAAPMPESGFPTQRNHQESHAQAPLTTEPPPPAPAARTHRTR